MSDEFFGVKVNAGRMRSMVKIVNAMLELLKTKKYDGVSVTEVCEAAGVTRKTFYRHFEAKQAVIEAALDTMFFAMTKAFDFAETKSREIMLFAFEYLEKDRLLANVFLDCGLLDVISSKVIEYVEMAFDDTLHNVASFEPALAEYYHKFIADGMISLVRTWVADGFKQSAKTMAALTERLLSGVIS